MAKYHINPETGNANLCRARVRCRFQREGEPPVVHYATKEEAQAAYAHQQEGEAFVPSLRRRSIGEEERLAQELLREVRLGFTGERLSEEEVRSYAPFVFQSFSKIEGEAARLKFAVMEAQVLYKRRRLEELSTEEATVPATTTYEALAGEEAAKALRYYNETYGELERHLTEEERETLHSYTGLLFYRLNQKLRGELPPEEMGEEKAVTLLDKAEKNLDSILAKAPAWWEEVPLYRVLIQDFPATSSQLLSAGAYADVLDLREGQVVTFPAYSSTTIDPGYVASFAQDDAPVSVVLKFATKRGAPVQEGVADLLPTAFVQDREREVLLPRDASFKVVRREKASYKPSPSSGLSPVEVLTIHLEDG